MSTRGSDLRIGKRGPAAGGIERRGPARAPGTELTLCPAFTLPARGYPPGTSIACFRASRSRHVHRRRPADRGARSPPSGKGGGDTPHLGRPTFRTRRRFEGHDWERGSGDLPPGRGLAADTQPHAHAANGFHVKNGRTAGSSRRTAPTSSSAVSIIPTPGVLTGPPGPCRSVQGTQPMPAPAWSGHRYGCPPALPPRGVGPAGYSRSRAGPAEDLSPGGVRGRRRRRRGS